MLTTIHSAVSCPHPAARTPLLEKLQHLRGYTSMPPLKVWSWSPDTPVEPGDVGLGHHGCCGRASHPHPHPQAGMSSSRGLHCPGLGWWVRAVAIPLPPSVLLWI